VRDRHDPEPGEARVPLGTRAFGVEANAVAQGQILRVAKPDEGIVEGVGPGQVDMPDEDGGCDRRDRESKADQNSIRSLLHSVRPRTLHVGLGPNGFQRHLVGDLISVALGQGLPKEGSAHANSAIAPRH
jgi:hypothetical protein